MGVLKLSVIKEQNKLFKNKLRVSSKKGNPYRVGNCSCPCECFIKEGEGVMYDDIAATASWNID